MITPQMQKSTPFVYARQVLAGEIVTGGYVKKAVQRFFNWIDTAENDGYYLDHAAGMAIVVFFEMFLQHTKGPIAGQPFILSPYQQFTFYNVFAWKHTGTGKRRINTVYDKQARKNAKTAHVAGLGLFCQSFEGEQGAEIYVGATKEAQAKICWEQAEQYIKKSSKLKQIGFREMAREIKFNPSMSVFRFLGGDSKTQDGLNPSVSIIDEYHAHKDDSVKEVLESAMGARTNPLTYIITTAGFDVHGVCKNYEDVVKDVLDGTKKDDSLFAMVHDLDDGDDWENPENWRKANPNMDHNPTILAHMEKEFVKAKNQPSKIPNFKTKHLNLWVDAPTVWIPADTWKKNKVDCINSNLFFELGAIGGLDLSTTTDITALVYMTKPDENGFYYLREFYFCPKDTIDKRSKEDRVPYRAWMDAGHLIATPGNSVDYEYILDTIKSTYMDYNVQEIEFDRYNSSHLINQLQEQGVNVAGFNQSIGAMSLPTKFFEKLVYDGKLKHSGNPITQWMLSGVAIYSDANENIKVHKAQSTRRVDGIVAAIMALGGLLVPNDNNESAYNNNQNEIYF